MPPGVLNIENVVLSNFFVLSDAPPTLGMENY
jgi:hypothetical protein